MPPNCLLHISFEFSPYGPKLKILNQEFKHFGLRHYLGKFNQITIAASQKKSVQNLTESSEQGKYCFRTFW